MKKINYSERANFYDLEVIKDEIIISFIQQITKILDIKKIINCPCASGIYLLEFKKNYQYSYFIDVDKNMIEKINKKIRENKVINIEALQLDISNLNKLNGLSDCIVMLNQGLQYIELKEFQKLLNKLDVEYLILDLFDFKKEGKLTYFSSNIKENSYFLTREFQLDNKTIKRYNKYNWDGDKITFKYKYLVKKSYKYTTNFTLNNYPFEDVCNIIKSSNYKINKIYGDYNFCDYIEKNAHYILILKRR